MSRSQQMSAAQALIGALEALAGGAGSAFTALSFAKSHARRCDPVTSHEAAAAAAPMASGHVARLILALVAGPAGKDELARRAGMGGHQVSRRLVDMAAAGLISWTGRYVSSDAGRREREWMLAGPAPA